MLLELRHHVQLQYAMAEAKIPLQEELMKLDTLSFLYSFQYTNEMKGDLVPGQQKFNRMENLKRQDGQDEQDQLEAQRRSLNARSNTAFDEHDPGTGFQDANELMVWLHVLKGLMPNPRELEILYVPDVPEVSVIMCQYGNINYSFLHFRYKNSARIGQTMRAQEPAMYPKT